MMQFVSKWKVTVYHAMDKPGIELVIWDNHYTNVVNKIAAIGFEIDPIRVNIQLVTKEP